MKKEEILNAFQQVIDQLSRALEAQTGLVPYVKIEAKIEAYTDALKLLSENLEDTKVEEVKVEEPKTTKK